MQSYQFLLFVVQCARAVDIMAAAFVSLLLKEYTPDWLITSIDTGGVACFFLRTARNGGLIRSPFNDATVAHSFLSRWPSGLSFFKYLLRGVARQTKFGINCQNTLDKPKDERSFFSVVGCLNFATAPLACSAGTRRPSRVTQLRCSTVSARNLYFSVWAGLLFCGVAAICAGLGQCSPLVFYRLQLCSSTRRRRTAIVQRQR